MVAIAPAGTASTPRTVEPAASARGARRCDRPDRRGARRASTGRRRGRPRRGPLPAACRRPCARVRARHRSAQFCQKVETRVRDAGVGDAREGRAGSRPPCPAAVTKTVAGIHGRSPAGNPSVPRAVTRQFARGQDGLPRPASDRDESRATVPVRRSRSRKWGRRSEGRR